VPLRKELAQEFAVEVTRPITKLIEFGPGQTRDREVEVGQRSFLAEFQMPAGLDAESFAAEQQNRQVIMIVGVAIRNP